MKLETIRTLLLVAAGFIVLTIYQTWQAEHPAKVVAGTPVAPGSDQLTGERPAHGDVPKDVVPAEPSDQPTEIARAPEQAAPLPATQPEEFITVETDLLRVAISRTGGTLKRLALLKHPADKSSIDPATGLAVNPYPLLDDEPARYQLVQSGLLGTSEVSPAPDHHAIYTAPQKTYRLVPGQQQLDVPLTWQDASGITVRKVLTFSRDSYLVQQRTEVVNNSGKPWRGRQYTQITRRPDAKANGSIFQPASFQGVAYYSPEEKFKKIAYKKLAETHLQKVLPKGWIAALEHYFVAAWLPDGGPLALYSKRLPGELFVVGAVTPPVDVDAAGTGSFTGSFYLGPAEQKRLKKAAEGLVLTVDYGYITPIAQPIFWLLKTIHGFVGNWGLSILLVTLLIKLAFYRLSATSYRSMANMRKLQPRLVALKERFGDDRQALNQKMMELYKTEKINPLGGCLPILIQIPVFIALYWVLLQSVELRHAPFVGWIQDLSAKDPYYVLPALMTLSMVAQQRLNPAPVDPVQQKVMMVMPWMFGVFFAFFPAGLVLYWLANNLISIAQQWYITRQIESAA